MMSSQILRKRLEWGVQTACAVFNSAHGFMSCDYGVVMSLPFAAFGGDGKV